MDNNKPLFITYEDENFINAKELDSYINELFYVKGNAEKATFDIGQNRIYIFNYLKEVNGVKPPFAELAMETEVTKREKYVALINQVLVDLNVYTPLTFKKVMHTTVDMTYNETINGKENLPDEAYEATRDICRVMVNRNFCTPIFAVLVNDKLDEYPRIEIVFLSHNPDYDLRDILEQELGEY